MPLYEYRCKSCGHRFETLVYGSRRPICPRCEGNDLDRLLSTFATNAAASSGKGSAGSFAASTRSCSSGGG